MEILSSLAGIFFVIGIFGLFLGAGIGIYDKFKPGKRWDETAHDVAGRAMLILVAAFFFYLFSHLDNMPGDKKATTQQSTK